ncbi:uncharacterized protein [Ptychodera flava]|uniref:uncharacterized protein n=1 Tax=Ptychodera flava TaxID=63121 RepID=UPI00396A6367
METSWICLRALLAVAVVISQGVICNGHPCRRICEYPPAPMTCEYDFVAEWYYSMSKACYNCPINKTDCLRPHCIPLNGVPRPIAVINRLLPGPSIEVCYGDQLIINVTNHLDNNEGIAMHWHGQHLKDYQHMDGAAMITQCPITYGSTFTYEFPAKTGGTHWWHAHSGLQRADGIFGAMIIRYPEQDDPHSDLYDEDLSEHMVFITDWLDEITMLKFVAHHHDKGDNQAEAMLINGKGKRRGYTDGDDTHYTDREVYYVEQSMRYRFRMISNAITFCPMQISIDDHRMLVIASDGVPFESYETDVLIVYGGESFDFILTANQIIGNYWFRVKGLADCSFKNASGLAILRYHGSDEVDPSKPESYQADDPDAPENWGTILNPFNKEASEREIPIYYMNATEPDDITSESVDRKIYLAMDFNKIDNPKFHHPDFYPISAVAVNHHLYSTQVNDVSFKHASSPLLTQHKDVVDEICTPETLQDKNCSTEFCSCTYVHEVGLGQVVELVVIDEGVTFNSNHPMHIHGHSFRVVAMEKLGVSTSLEEVKALDEAGGIYRKLHRAVKKDTVTIPDGGFSIIRFYADNPGFWLFHCHLEFHLEIGMSVVFKVGSDDDMPETPKGFPRCGSWPHGYTLCPSNEISAASPMSQISWRLLKLTFILAMILRM